MERIDGPQVTLHPLKGLERIADLIHFDGPLLTLFENQQSEPYLFLWADVDEETHRWIAFRVSHERLSSYLHRLISLRDLLIGAGDGVAFVTDISAPEVFDRVWMVNVADLPTTYLPDPDSLYEFTPRETPLDLAALARRYGSPILDLHMLRGKGIGFGTADVVPLGALLRATGELAESIAVSRFAGGTRDKEGAQVDPRAYGQFEFVTQRAASFSAILRPMVAQENIPGFRDRTSEVVEVLLGLIESTPDYAGLKSAAANHQDTVIRKLETFAKEVQAHGVGLEVRWAMPTTREVRRATIDRATSGRIINNINRLENEESLGFWAQGFFLAVDTKLRSYRFLTVADRESTGHFDPRMGFPVTNISFKVKYRVYMNRRTAKVSGRAKPRIAESIAEIAPTNNPPPDGAT